MSLAFGMRFGPHETQSALGVAHGPSAQAFARARISRSVGGQQLDGDGSIETRVVCAIGLAYATGADGREDLTRAEARAGSEHQRRTTV